MTTLARGSVVRIVQITDCHLFEDTQGKLLGLNTEDSLQLVLERVRAEQPDVHLFLATGDLSQDGSASAYARFHEAMQTFNKPVYWLPGNHDCIDDMRDCLQGEQYLSPCVIEAGDWRILMLDSTIVGKVPGQMSDEELVFLDEQLVAHKDSHVMVVLHHHPVPVGSVWLDKLGVKNPEAFFAITDRYPNIKSILWGHVHQEYDQIREGARLLATPSTCVQFKPGSEEFAVDDLAPGYRWLDLHPDGRIETGVSRVQGVEFEVDYSVKGY